MNTPKILIVDDEEKNIKLLKGILSSNSYNFYEALSGEDAMNLVYEIRPDLILLDVMMPGISGFEVCQKLKQDEKTKSIPIVMVTALSEKEHRLKAMEAFADDFLSKPVDSTEVVIRVKSLLRIKAYHDEIASNLKKIAEKNEKLKNLEKIKDDLIHMIVHDLRNPLCSVFGNLDLLLLDKDKIPPNKINLLQNCKVSCQELTGMIDSLLDIHKIEEWQIQINLETTDLHELIKESIQPFHSKAADEKITISVDHSYRNLFAPVDRSIMKRVLANLVGNAIRHTPCGGRIKISAGYCQNNGDLLVEVKDTGNGIESAYQEKIFNKFEQVKLRRSGVSVGSSGLGLAFCKLALEAHGGKIWVESEGEGKGAKFRFTLPANSSHSSFADD